ncbi:MAG: response regulator transcription factor [Synechococcaceae cyanobacterium SM2_3_60]|nr:response regulator transcription factor [Synechococcaceae cyanobacterium SM2_3_60]
MRILIVEDDFYLAESISDALTTADYTVEVANDGLTGLQKALTLSHDLLLLDVTLPRLDGLQVCRQLRHQGVITPIVMLTARDTRTDKVMGLDSGADVYMVKPVDLDELLAQIRASLRRGQRPLHGSELRWGLLRLCQSTHEVYYGEVALYLTPKEFEIVVLLLQRGRHITKRQHILDQVWHLSEVPNEETIKAHIKGIRGKLAEAGAPKTFIESIYGVGYRLADVSATER